MVKSFCERLKELREENNLTHRSLAKKIEVEHSTISRWENGQVSPSIDYLIKLSNLFNVSTDFLLGLKDY